MGWDGGREVEPEVQLGRQILGAAIRQARLRHGLSQRQLGWYVSLDQTTVSKLETAKLKGIRFKLLCRVIGTMSKGGAFELPAAPRRSPRRLPGEDSARFVDTAAADAAAQLDGDDIDDDAADMGGDDNAADGDDHDDDDRDDDHDDDHEDHATDGAQVLV